MSDPSARTGTPPKAGPEQWSSFEMRMRGRRFARCVANAKTALEAGDREAALAALAEARTLQSDAPELAALEEQLVDMPVATPMAGTAPAPGAARKGRWMATAAAAAILLAAGATIRPWSSPDGRDELPAPVAQLAATPIATVGVPSGADAGLRIVRETVQAVEVVPRIELDEPRLPAYPAPPIAESNPAPLPDSVVAAVNREPAPAETPAAEPRPSAATPPPPLPQASLDLPVRAVAPPPAAVPETVTAGRTTASSSTPAAERERGETREAAAAVTRDDPTIVRSVLRRYEAAYSSLDAEAASAVWPAVNRGALARAFDGLASQQVSLGACNVTVNGPSARATCTGSATWEPKVGGGRRTEQREWSFDLQRSGDGWRIERAITR